MSERIRTKVNLIPESVREARAEVGRIRVVETEPDGKGNERIRNEVVDG